MNKLNIKMILLVGSIVNSAVMADNKAFIDISNNVSKTACFVEEWAACFFDDNHVENYKVMVKKLGNQLNSAKIHYQSYKDNLKDNAIEVELSTLVNEFYINLQEIYEIFEKTSVIMLPIKLGKHGDIDYAIRMFEQKLLHLQNKSENSSSLEVTNVLANLIKELSNLREQWYSKHPSMNAIKWGAMLIKTAQRRTKQ
jgi:hypothetical protein